MTNRIDLDTAEHTLSAGLLPYSDGSGYELRVTLRTDHDQEKPDTIEINGVGDNSVRITVGDWPKLRDTVDRLIEFTSTLIEVQR